MTAEAQAIIIAYAEQGFNACTGKGGFFVEGRGHVTLRRARKETGINQSQPRAFRPVVAPWGRRRHNRNPCSSSI
jgi:hypothetical protein